MTDSPAAKALEMAGEATLEIPPEYLVGMRYAALHEITEETKALSAAAHTTRKNLEKEGFEARHGLREPHDLHWLMSDLNGTRRHVQEALDVTELLCADNPRNIAGTPAALAYLLDAFARHIVVGEIQESYGPLEDDDDRNSLAPFIAALEWAGTEGGRLRALDLAERQAAKKNGGQS